MHDFLAHLRDWFAIEARVSAIRDWFDFRYWATRVAISHRLGRWYYFRDAPDHVVAFFAMLVDDSRTTGDALTIGQAAATERELRRLRGEWDVELDSEFSLDP